MGWLSADNEPLPHTRKYINWFGSIEIGMAREQSTGRSALSRRSFVKTTAAAVLGGAVVGQVGAATRVNIVEQGADDTGSTPVNDVLTSVHGDGETIYFPAGTYLLDPIRLSGSNWKLVGDGPGETIIRVPDRVNGSNDRYLSFSGSNWEFDGFTIDLSSPNAAPVNYLTGTDWAFRNVQMKGQMGDPATRQESNLFYPNVTSSGATGLMENVEMKDGSADPDGSSNRGGMWFGTYNVGHMILRGLHMEGFANNTLYASSSDGTVTIEDCYFKNSNVGVRVGGGMTIKNSVWVQDGNVPAQRWTGGRVGRGLWINSNKYDPGTVHIEGCEFKMTSSVASSAIFARHAVDDLVIRDCRIEQGNGKAAVRVRDGVDSLTVENVSVTGSSTAPAFLCNSSPGATFTGVCVQTPGTGIQLANSASCRIESSTINVDGKAIVLDNSTLTTKDFTQSGACPIPDLTSPVGSGGTSSTNDPALDHVLTVDGTGQTDPTTYQFDVTGSVEKSTDADASIDFDDVVSGQHVEGTVYSWIDSYRFSGDISSFSLDGPASVILDGQVVDPATLGTGALPNTLRIEGGTASQPIYYEFTVSGGLEKAVVDGSTNNDGDAVDGSHGSGFVAGGADGYRFGGELTGLIVGDGATVTVNGSVIDPAQYDASSALPNTVVIDGTGTSGTSEYVFEVDGPIMKSPSLGSVSGEDTITNGRVEGVVSGGVDGFRYAGDITSFILVGSAEVTFDDND